MISQSGFFPRVEAVTTCGGDRLDLTIWDHVVRWLSASPSIATVHVHRHDIIKLDQAMKGEDACSSAIGTL
ncbi:MAG: hypothetical protein E5V66_11085 [Mesorhizobium sp.]|uniref:hypothetical protein n=1 Tax=Mesorhizobium sp. TaxID=1871066 RepID=UPI00120EEC9F|nr:hypothetical protein [Mesorhizobium sp.]TIW11986.1 MAG: hypothetical protein E5V66_11085 [Mesorhizobium sp.]